MFLVISLPVALMGRLDGDGATDILDKICYVIQMNIDVAPWENANM